MFLAQVQQRRRRRGGVATSNAQLGGLHVASNDPDAATHQIGDGAGRMDGYGRIVNDGSFSGSEGIGSSQVVTHDGRQSGDPFLRFAAQGERAPTEQPASHLRKVLPDVVVPAHDQAATVAGNDSPRGDGQNAGLRERVDKAYDIVARHRDVGVKMDPRKHVTDCVGGFDGTGFGRFGQLDDADSRRMTARNLCCAVGAAVGHDDDVEFATAVEQRCQVPHNATFFVVRRDHDARDEPRTRLGWQRIAHRVIVARVFVRLSLNDRLAGI